MSAITTRSRRPSVDESFLAGEEVAFGQEDREIEVVIEKDPGFLIPGLGFNIHASLGLLTTTYFRFTREGAKRKAEAEFHALRLKRDGKADLEKWVDDPANPEPTPAELTRIRHQQEAQNWDEMFRTVEAQAVSKL